MIPIKVTKDRPPEFWETLKQRIIESKKIAIPPDVIQAYFNWEKEEEYKHTIGAKYDANVRALWCRFTELCKAHSLNAVETSLHIFHQNIQLTETI